MFDRYPPKSVVVGVDGSRAAIRAARWAVDEVALTDTPLRLLYVTKPNPGASPAEAGAALVAAEEVIHNACSAIDEMGRPVKIETEIIEGHPVAGLIDASRSTTLLCVGDTGAAQHPDVWLGSTAKELAESGHCTVAIVRGDRRDTGAVGEGWIVALADESPDGIDVLQMALHEAQHRCAPLRVLTAAELPSSHFRDPDASDSHMQRCVDDYADVEIETFHSEGSFLNYLTEHAESIELAVIGAAQAGELRQLLGAPGAMALRDSHFSLLVVGFERPGR
ncbi:universal stress protein UspA-like protein [Mycobacterium numidiamassiliense]|uniref:Universal stress protein UspA-like protein n=1 Tax=Mycobacterium numidiamassiliense TaxID=1841861 RepID=A0A2U3PF76_9MYCO|nr:universal stress protein [Mycobacterium numidiamassiliense]SPM42424.1 universal stress protein UspA-like protein [Mycobacterium numidiamassiliense]